MIFILFDIEESKQNLKILLEKIISKGWIKARHNSYVNVGNTFESELGKKIDSLPVPDFGNIEIKVRSDEKAYDFTTLFNASADNSFFVSRSLRDKYGYPDKTFGNFKVFISSIYSDHFSRIGSYLFKLNLNREKEILELNIYNRKFELIENFASWSFQMLKEKLYLKLNYLLIVNSKRKWNDGNLYFKYHNYSFYELKSFESFLEAIQKGYIRVTFKVGIYKSGKRYGTTHDHGTSFDICEDGINLVFQKDSL